MPLVSFYTPWKHHKTMNLMSQNNGYIFKHHKQQHQRKNIRQNIFKVSILETAVASYLFLKLATEKLGQISWRHFNAFDLNSEKVHQVDFLTLLSTSNMVYMLELGYQQKNSFLLPNIIKKKV